MSEHSATLARLPVGSVGHRASGWYGMMMVIATEGALFAYLLFSYYYFATQYGRPWLPDELPAFRLSGPGTVVLLSSSVAVWWGERAAKRGSRGSSAIGLLIGILLGAAFLTIQLMEWRDKPFTIASSAYGSLYFTITGFHLAHVAFGLAALLVLLFWTLLGYFDSHRNAPVSIGSIYWHFVDAVWLAIFFTIYVTPHMGIG